MSSKAHHDFRFPFVRGVPRDYLARRKMFRKVSGIVMLVLFSVLVAGIILLYSDPNLSFLR